MVRMAEWKPLMQSADLVLPECQPNSCGGIKVSARGGKIVCKNTLDSRLDIAFKEIKPQIRGNIDIRPVVKREDMMEFGMQIGILFGVRPAPVTKASVEPSHHGH